MKWNGHGNILGDDFLGRNFPRESSPGGSLMGGNFPLGNSPRNLSRKHFPLAVRMIGLQVNFPELCLFQNLKPQILFFVPVEVYS